jgi:hypothetical protein
MSTGAIVFMALAWTFVLGLLGWCYYRLMTTPPDDTNDDRHDVDPATGPRVD